VRPSPEELVNSASPELALRFVRSRVNQPDPAFPRSPGIIPEQTTSILLAAACSVLSMNCEHHNNFLFSDNELICTRCSLDFVCGQSVNNAIGSMISTEFIFTSQNYSQGFQMNTARVNKLCLRLFIKIALDRKFSFLQFFHARMKRHLPFVLTTLRLFLGPVALTCAFTNVARWIYLPILITATVSDILDGVLARRFGVATPALRRYDSITDIIYYLFILAAAWKLCRPVIVGNLWLIGLMLLSEAGAILVCLIRFRKFPATHSFLAKFYGLCLLAGLIALLVFNAGNWAIVLLTIVALVTNTEIFAMHLIAHSAPVDVPCIFALVNRK
jgi:phosphatidylglycerophosphate synthase